LVCFTELIVHQYEELRRKHSILQGEVSELRGTQPQVMVARCPTPPDFVTANKGDNVSRRTKENAPPLPTIVTTFSKGWENYDARKRSPQPPTYDYATSIEGCLSIISTPHVDECALRDEGEMKEMLSDLLTDPVTARRRAFNPMNLDSPSSLRVPSSSKYRTATYDSSHHSHSTSVTTASTAAAASDPKPLVTQPEVPLWTKKRSVRATPYNRDTKGKAISMSRSLSASEAE